MQEYACANALWSFAFWCNFVSNTQERPNEPQCTSRIPKTRFRRARQSAQTRALIRENRISVEDLIWPVFICDGEDVEQPVNSMPGVMRRSVDKLVEAAKEAADLGIPAICLFPYTDPAKKTKDCAEAWNPNNLSNTATRAIKSAVPDIAIMTDVALDPYNIDGHDGFVVDGKILNDETVEALVKQALSQAEAGADIIGPSDMMDGRIGALRNALESHGHTNVMLMSYAAKYASGFYGPFRDAVGASGALKGIKAAIKWILPIVMKRCVWSRVTLAKAQIWSWSNQACPIWIFAA